MKVLIVLMFLFATSFFGYAQMTEVSKELKCSDKIRYVSYYWKLDSQSNNGYRKLTRYGLSNCKIDGVPADTVVKWLGKPDEIWPKTNLGSFVYRYFTYDYFKMDTTQWDGPYGADLINFFFDGKTKKLQTITKSSQEYGYGAKSNVFKR